jgi:polyketide cyclase/dehydrase/lipid transport protein
MMNLRKHGRSETTTTASAADIWPILSDPSRLGEWSHETSEGVWLDGSTSARPGARFRASNTAGRFRWTRISEIVEAEEPHVLAWRTIPTATKRDSTEWRITLEPTEAGTRIVQTFDVVMINPVVERVLWLILKVHRDRSDALAGDIERLSRAAESASRADERA